MTPTQTTLASCICGKVECGIPYGYCHCRCGMLTNLADKTDKTCVLGQPRRFIYGHQRKIRPVEQDAAPFKIDGDPCRLIPLTRGLYAIVDAADYEWLMQWKWTVKRGRYTFYAYRNDYSGGQHHVTMHALLCPASPGNETDHRNGNGLDNRRSNLREATPSQQRQNEKIRSDNSTGHKGISACAQTGLYKASLKIGGRYIWLGRHASLESATSARKRAEAQYFGEFARA
jgi:hypothetical protein